MIMTKMATVIITRIIGKIKNRPLLMNNQILIPIMKKTP